MTKPELFSVFDNAWWPALLVDGAGAIRAANEAAVAAFGSGVAVENTHFAAIWSPENPVRAEQFLLTWHQSENQLTPLKFLVKGGGTKNFQCGISCTHAGGDRLFLFQFLPAAPAAPPAPAAAPSVGQTTTFDSPVALKQRLDCVLQLTRTVALDFNNTLTTILGHTSLLLGKIENNHPHRASLIETEKAATKAAEIAHDLAAFSWQEKEAKSQQAGNLNELLFDTAELFHIPSNNVMWSMQLESRLFSANFDQTKLQQAFSKIIENAIQATGNEGRIIVRTRNVEVHEPMRDGNVTLAPGRYVCGEVADSGCGIAPEILPRIFEPFFTTKQSPQHRGLGLAWVYGIVTNHNGCVAVSSQPGQGTSVRVYLPALTKIVNATIHHSKDEELGGTQSILLVDDEELLLTMGQMVLSSFGYTVQSANSGERALELLKSTEARFDLMITDLVMPGMSGRELIEHARRIAPSLKFLCTSGFVRPGGSNEQGDFLQKPFTSQDLLRKIRHVLEVENAA